MSDDQLVRVRGFCLRLPETTERLSHGEPTFFVRNKVFVMFANNHHNDGRIAIWLPVPYGFQEGLIESAPDIFFKPPYVGTRGWVGIKLEKINNHDLEEYIAMAWELIAPKGLRAQKQNRTDLKWSGIGWMTLNCMALTCRLVTRQEPIHCAPVTKIDAFIE